jgi:hypothetical protein
MCGQVEGGQGRARTAPFDFASQVIRCPPPRLKQSPFQIMASEARQSRRKLTAREMRMLLYLLAVLAVASWKFVPRPWHPTITLEGPHHLIFSSATRSQTEDTAHMLDLLYIAYPCTFSVFARTCL